MKAIVTKYHGATDTKPGRYSATAEGVGRIYKSSDYDLTSYGNHEAMARALAEKHGWLRDGSRLAGGCLPDGKHYAWVFVQTDPELIRQIESARTAFQAGGRGGETMGAVSLALDLALEALKGGR